MSLIEEKVIILDYGCQFTLLIAKVLRDEHCYSEVRLPSVENYDIIPNMSNLKAVILSGGPNSVYNLSDEEKLNFKNFMNKLREVKIPLLGICYGAQIIAQALGVRVLSGKREYGNTMVCVKKPGHSLFRRTLLSLNVWMSHSDYIDGTGIKNSPIKVLATTRNEVIAAFESNNVDDKIYGVQFHPEVTHTPQGRKVIHNFLEHVGCSFNWTPEKAVETIIESIREQIPVDSKSKVLVACSGGVDSTVTATLIQKALGNDKMRGIFINNGLLRKGEYEEVMNIFGELDLNVIGEDHSQLFYNNLEDITDPEEKRKIIGKTFIDIFTDIASGDDINFTHLGQGTIYPDVVESHGKIKSHHNVGGLPEKLHLKLLEPLRLLFKDEVREIGRVLNIPKQFLDRHPFPGPGLGIRILGNITEQKVSILQEADDIFIKNLHRDNLYKEIWQAATILTDSKSVGVMGDNRTYENVLVLRAVTSINGMTAEVAKLPLDFLTRTGDEIVNEVKGINRVVYDVTSKPPGTIEWL